jgi:protein-tyrosine-phosphatase
MFQTSPLIKKMLIICIGNTCRSILFHSIIHSFSNKKFLNYDFYSCGVSVESSFVSSNTSLVLINNNIDIIKFRPQPITDFFDVYFDDIIILDNTISLPSQIQFKNFFYFNIDDPFDKDLQEYQKTFDTLFHLILSFK